MKVVAKRDDGALLVTDGAAALVVSGDKTWLTSRDSALARGNWQPSTDAVPIAALRERAKLAAYRTELDAQESRRP